MRRRSQSRIRQSAAIVTVLSLLVLAASANGLELRDDEESVGGTAPIDALDGNRTFGSTQNRTISVTLPDESQVTGHWKLVVEGLDPTVGHADAFSRIARNATALTWSQISPLVANTPEVPAGEQATVVSFVERSMNAHVGWFEGKIVWPTNDSIPRGSVAAMDFQPGTGWFLGLARPLQAALPSPVTAWEPSGGERFTATCGASHPDDLFAGTPTYVSEALVTTEEGSLDAASGPYGGFRLDALHVKIDPDEHCDGLELSWKLRFVSEARALNPQAVANCLEVEDPWCSEMNGGTNPESLLLGYTGDVRAYSIGSYSYESRLEVGGAWIAGEERLQANHPQDPMDVRQWYAPLYPLHWICTATSTDCVAEDLAEQAVAQQQAGGGPDMVAVAAGRTSATTDRIALALQSTIGEVHGFVPTLESSGPGWKLTSAVDAFVSDSTTEMFEGGSAPAGWTMDGLWHVSDLCSEGLGAGAASSYLGYHRSSACDYDTGSVTTGKAKFTVDLAGADRAALGFIHFFEVESYASSPYDVMRVEVRQAPGVLNDILYGESWEVLGQWDSSDPTNGAWSDAWFDLSAYAGGQVEVRFVFDSVDAAFNDYAGWHIDRVRVTAIEEPSSGSGGSGGGGSGGCCVSMYAM